MKVLIVAKTRQGGGACIGGISQEGRSVRLVSPDPEDERWGLDFNIGDVWEVEGGPPAHVIPPHVENLVVWERRWIRRTSNLVPTIERYMPPVTGGVDALYNGLVQRRPSGTLCITRETGIPSFSTQFWRPDRSLRRITPGKRIRYECPSEEAPSSLVFVGFQEPVEEIPAGTLLRVSLAHWWHPPDHSDDELRCYLQVSGWFGGGVGGTHHGDTETRSGAQSGRAGEMESGREQPAVGSQQSALSLPGMETLARIGGSGAPNAQGPGPNARPATLHDARGLLARVFGYTTFRPLQERIIENVLQGRDTLGVMPTGAGKSLCYQLPALLFEGLTVVVSPLLSLMQDQVEQLRAAGVPAVTLNSMLTHAEYVANQRRIRSGEARLLYVAPETLLRPETGVLLEQRGVACLTVDEAHCISEWGHDFRPEYRQLRPVRARYPQAVCLALTATATGRVQQDIRSILGVAAEDTFVAPFDRPNLYLEARRREDGPGRILEFLIERPEQSGIIYCSTREQVDQLVAQLSARGFRALPYHAGLPDGVRRENQRLFQLDEVPLIVATVAFGMGINKPNVRFILHQTMPDCIETYYQQVGRAGRDGARADCLLLFGRSEIGTAFHFIEQGAQAERQGRMFRLQAMVRYAESTRCRRRSLVGYFGDELPEGLCGMCDNCLAEASGRQQVDVSEDARLFLQCVQQVGQRFGVTYVVDVLRGSRAERILKWRHEQLSIHGTGRHRSGEAWRLLADRFIELGLIEAELEHGTLRLLPAGREALAGEPVMVVMDTPKPAPKVAADRAHDPILFEALRRLRREIAEEAGVPPYVIFSDRTLTEMAAAAPQSREALLQVHGVGEHKAAVYGERFLEVVYRHLEEHGLTVERVEPAPAAASPGGRRFYEVGEAFSAGASMTELQERWGVTRGTILNHLVNYQRAGGVLAADRLLEETTLSEADRTRVLALFDEMGHDRLGPIHAALNGSVDYSELHLLRLYRVCLGSEEQPAEHAEHTGESE